MLARCSHAIIKIQELTVECDKHGTYGINFDLSIKHRPTLRINLRLLFMIVLLFMNAMT